MKKILGLIALLLATAFASATPCPTGYAFTYSLTILTQSGLSGNLSNFPMYWAGDAALKTVANGGVVQTAGGLDVVWCDAAVGGNLLPYELVSGTFGATTGLAQWFILVPVVSHTTTGTIYARVGKGSASDLSNSPGTWPSYLGVWHGGADDGSIHLTDSTGTSSSPTNHGATNNVGIGFIPGGFDLTGANQSFDTGNKLTSTIYTVEAMGFFPSFAGARVLGVAGNNTSVAGFNFYAFNGGLSVGIGGAGGDSLCRSTGAGLNTGTWTHVAGVYNGGNATLTGSYAQYLNGGVISCSMAASGSSSMVAPTANMSVGDIIGGSNELAILDEVRISSVARSADWIHAGSINLQTPTSFYGTLTLVSTNTGSGAFVTVIQ